MTKSKNTNEFIKEIFGATKIFNYNDVIDSLDTAVELGKIKGYIITAKELSSIAGPYNYRTIIKLLEDK